VWRAECGGIIGQLSPPMVVYLLSTSTRSTLLRTAMKFWHCLDFFVAEFGVSLLLLTWTALLRLTCLSRHFVLWMNSKVFVRRATIHFWFKLCDAEHLYRCGPVVPACKTSFVQQALLIQDGHLRLSYNANLMLAMQIPMWLGSCGDYWKQPGFASDAQFSKATCDQLRNNTQINGICLACRMILLPETHVHACSMLICSQQMMLLPGTSMHTCSVLTCNQQSHVAYVTICRAFSHCHLSMY